MLKQLDSFTVSEHWLPAIINCDITGLSDEEEQQLETFLNNIQQPVIWRCDNTTFWTRDDITGLFSMCVELEAWG